MSASTHNSGATTAPQPRKTEQEYFSVAQAARFLGLNHKTLRLYLPEIPGVVRLSERTTRIPKTGLAAWLRQFQTQETQQ
jgi:hypothetical protein